MMLETTISPCRAHIWKIASASALCYKIMAMGFWQKQDNIHIPDWKEAVFLGMNGSQQAIHQEACHVLTQSHGSKKKREAGVTARMSHGSWGEFSVFEGNMFFFWGGQYRNHFHEHITCLGQFKMVQVSWSFLGTNSSKRGDSTCFNTRLLKKIPGMG